ncbi:MAG: lysophospholipid acyltransferase family protein [Planctomycetota bacterium]
MSYSYAQRIAANAIGGAARVLFGLSLRHQRQACRFHFRGPLDDALRRGDQVIVAGWHQDVLPFFHYLANYSCFERTQRFRMMSSRSFDGEVTERIMRPWGFRFVRGSYGKIGAGAALRGYLRAIRDGDSVAIIADGPTPPPYVFRPGAIFLAQASGIPLYVCRAWTRPQWIVPSTWFRLTVPLPAHHCAIWSSGPIDVSGDPEEARLLAEAEMRRLGEEVDAALYLRRRIAGGVRLGDRWDPEEAPARA